MLRRGCYRISMSYYKIKLCKSRFINSPSTPMNASQPFRQLYIVIFGMLFFYAAAGQTSRSPTSLTLKPATDFDQRFYYVGAEVQNVWGYRIGVLVNDRYKVGVGAYYMNQNYSVTKTGNGISRQNDPTGIINKKMYLGTLYYEPYLLRKNLWESSLVFETGYGKTVNAMYQQANGELTERREGKIIPAGVGLSVNFKLPALFNIECLRWVGINAMAGYRLSIYQDDKQYHYNGAYWSLSGAIFLDRVVDDFNQWRRQRSLARSQRRTQLHF